MTRKGGAPARHVQEGRARTRKGRLSVEEEALKHIKGEVGAFQGRLKLPG